MTAREDAATAAVRDGICVLGMHRSGTSLVAGLLHELGVFVGKEDELLGPNPSNRRGHWELQAVIDLNDELLAAFGGGWNSIPGLEEGWHSSAQIEPLRKKARALLTEQFAGLSTWAWKDPRTCITLPFWQQLIPGMRYVICVRNPIDIAESLRARDGDEPPFQHHVSNWLRYTALALEHTSARPRMVVHYEEFFSNPEATLRRIAGFIDLEERLKDVEVHDRARAFIEPSLAHARTPAADAMEDPRVDEAAAALYQELRLIRHAETSRTTEVEGLAQEWKSLDRLARRLRIRHEAGAANAARITELEQTVTEQRDELDQRAGRVTELENLNEAQGKQLLERDEQTEIAEAAEQQLKEMQKKLASTSKELRAREKEVGRLEGWIAERDKQIVAFEPVLVRMDDAMGALDKSAAQLAERLGSVEAELAAARKEAAGRDKRLSGLDHEIAQREEALAKAEARVAEQQGQLERQQQALAKAEARVAEQQGQLERQQQALGQAEARVAEQQGQLEQLQQALAQRDDAQAKAEARVAQQQQALAERDDRLRNQEQFFRHQSAEMRTRLAESEQRVQGFLHSRSWRVTRPMRRIGLLFSRSKRGEA